MRFSTAAVLIAALAACVTPPAPPQPPAASIQLTGTGWLRVDDEDANPHGATLDFEAARASGHTGCNRWFAAVTQTGEALRFGDVGMTRMACPTQMQRDTERNFLSVLERTRYARFDQDALVLLDENRREIARFARNS